MPVVGKILPRKILVLEELKKKNRSMLFSDFVVCDIKNQEASRLELY